MKTVICDLDGTLANIDHRLHYLEKKDWAGFFAAVKDDTPNQWCVDLLLALRKAGYEIIYVSGRNATARSATAQWLHNISLDLVSTVYMRDEKDRRPDFELKEEIYEKHLKEKDILFVIEDRSQVVKMWRSKGLTVLQCDEGEF